MLEVGDKKEVVLSGPWSNRSGIVSVQGVVSGDVLLEYNVNLLDKLFTSNGLGAVEYTAWLDAGRLVYTLVDTQGSFDIPSTYISSVNGDKSNKLKQVYIGVELDYVSDEERTLIPAITEAIVREVKGVLGVTPVTHVVEYGDVDMLTDAEFNSLKAERNDARDISLAANPTIDVLNAEIANKNTIISGLEAIVKDKLLTT